MGTAHQTMAIPKRGAQVMATMTRMDQVDQVGDGEHDHITGTAQETVYGHFKTDHTEEPSHESEVTFSGQKGFCGTVGTKEKSNQ